MRGGRERLASSVGSGGGAVFSSDDRLEVSKVNQEASNVSRGTIILKGRRRQIRVSHLRKVSLGIWSLGGSTC